MCSLLVSSVWSWMLCRGFCLLSLSEEPCSSGPPGWDPRLPLRLQGTFPVGEDRGWHGILHHPYLCPGRTHGGAAAGGTGVRAPVTLVFPSAVSSALRCTTKNFLSLWEHLLGFLCRDPASEASRTLPVLAFLFGSVALLRGGVWPRLRQGFATRGCKQGVPGRDSRSGSCASGSYYAGC